MQSPLRRSLIITALLAALIAAVVIAAVALTPLGSLSALGSSSSEETSSEPSHAPRLVSVTVSGDLLWHEPAFNSGIQPDGTWDYTSVFAPMSKIINNVDLAICHQEVMFAPPEGPYTGYPIFAAPPYVAQGIADAGFDLCTTASNHTVDNGYEGIVRTADALDEAGVMHIGGARTPEEADQPTIFTTPEGVKIGIITGTYGTNGLPVPEPWMVPMLDPDFLLERARITKEAGADIVLAAMHAGDEGSTSPNQQQIEMAEILTASPHIDLVYGHHAHAVQPITKVNGKWVIYGLGNMIAHQQVDNYLAYDGLTVELTFEETGSATGDFEVAEVRYIPTLISPPGQMPMSVTPISSLDQTDSRVAASLERTRQTVRSLGAEKYPELIEG